MGNGHSISAGLARDVPLHTLIQGSTYNDLVLPLLKYDFTEIYNFVGPLPTLRFEHLKNVRVIGEGCFGVVMMCKHAPTGQMYAMKILNKTKVVKMKQVEHTLSEKHVQRSVKFPFLVSAVASFKDHDNVYVVMPLMNGGELFELIHIMGSLSEALSKFYAAQVILALEYLHYLDFVYRDLKPENIMLTQNGYLKITDFGFVKRLGMSGRTWTLCGTPEYMSPETFLGQGAGFPADWWTLGILIYEMGAGYTPFFSQNQAHLFENIASGRYDTPSYFSHGLKDVIKHLLEVDVTKRFGTLFDGTSDIKLHTWFLGTNWLGIYYQKIVPPYIHTTPFKGMSEDAAREAAASISQVSLVPTEEYEEQFQDF